MINLLPPEEKTKLLSEKKKKLVVILGITAIIPLLCFILILLSLRFYILAEVNAQKIVLEQAKKEYQTPDFLLFGDIIQKNNKVLSKIEPFYKKEVYFTDVLKMISGIARPQNLYLTNVLAARDEGQKIKITAFGFSQTRDDLLLFQKNMEENSRIHQISFSPESWVNPQNVRFNVTFEIKP